MFVGGGHTDNIRISIQTIPSKHCSSSTLLSLIPPPLSNRLSSSHRQSPSSVLSLPPVSSLLLSFRSLPLVYPLQWSLSPPLLPCIIPTSFHHTFSLVASSIIYSTMKCTSRITLYLAKCCVERFAA